MNVKVSIPVKLGGFTGQRNQWQEFERDYEVKRDGDQIVFEGSSSHAPSQIGFLRSDLERALQFLDTYRGGGS